MTGVKVFPRRRSGTPRNPRSQERNSVHDKGDGRRSLSTEEPISENEVVVSALKREIQAMKAMQGEVSALKSEIQAMKAMKGRGLLESVKAMKSMKARKKKKGSSKAARRSRAAVKFRCEIFSTLQNANFKCRNASQCNANAIYISI